MPSESNRSITDQFLNTLTRRGYSENTTATYRRILDDYSSWLDKGNLDIRRVCHRDLEAFQVSLVSGPRGKPLSAGRRGLYVAVLRSFYKHCIENSLTASPVIDWLDYPIQPNRMRQDILSLDEMRDLLAAAADKGGWQHIAIRIMLLSGLRAGETAALRVGDVSLKQREIIIRQAKGSKHRLVFFDRETKQHLSAYLKAKHLRLSPPFPSDIQLLDHKGVPRNTDQIYGAVKRIAKRAGITKNISPHSLRRTFATRLLDSGVKGINLKVVAELLGHASLRTTAKYAQIDEQSLTRVYHAAHPAHNGGI